MSLQIYKQKVTHLLLKKKNCMDTLIFLFIYKISKC